MRLGKDLEGKPIISVTDGRILGRTKDMYVDASLESMAGLYVGSEGVIRRKSMVISRDDVVLFGIDVILVKNSDVITSDKELPETKSWQRLKDVQGREVRTPGGTKLGVVGDVVLDESANIVGFSLSRVFVEGPLAEQGAVPRDAVVSTAQEDGSIGVDLAKVEGLGMQPLEKSPEAAAPSPEPISTPDEIPVQEEGITISEDVIDEPEPLDEEVEKVEIPEESPVTEETEENNSENKGAQNNEE